MLKKDKQLSTQLSETGKVELGLLQKIAGAKNRINRKVIKWAIISAIIILGLVGFVVFVSGNTIIGVVCIVLAIGGWLWLHYAFKVKKELVVVEDNKQAPRPAVKKTYSRKTIKLVLFGLLGMLGLGGMVLYLVSQNMIIGGISVLIAVVGWIGFYISFKEDKDLVVAYVGQVNKKQVNSIVIYPDEVKFEDIYIKEGTKGGGFLWVCENDAKPYFLLWENPQTKKIEPYTLPDQQYCDPEVFAQRYLELPCERKVQRRKESLLTKLRPVFLIVGIVIVWILIMTTTSPNNEEQIAWSIQMLMTA